MLNPNKPVSGVIHHTIAPPHLGLLASTSLEIHGIGTTEAQTQSNVVSIVEGSREPTPHGAKIGSSRHDGLSTDTGASFGESVTYKGINKAKNVMACGWFVPHLA